MQQLSTDPDAYLHPTQPVCPSMCTYPIAAWQCVLLITIFTAVLCIIGVYLDKANQKLVELDDKMTQLNIFFINITKDT